MACLSSFVPNGLNIKDDSVGEMVAIQFQKDGDYVEVILPRKALQPIFDQILVQTRIGPTTAIGSPETDLASVVTPEGHAVFQAQNGQVVLDIRLRTDDGPRNLSWSLDPAKARAIGEELIRYAGG